VRAKRRHDAGIGGDDGCRVVSSVNSCLFGLISVALQ
jgi:hypothetical protein